MHSACLEFTKIDVKNKTRVSIMQKAMEQISMKTPQILFVLVVFSDWKSLSGLK